MDWSCKVKPLTTGFYRGVRRVGEDRVGEVDGAGEPFLIGPGCFKIDRDGKVHTDKDRRPILPSWVKVLDKAVPPLPASIPNVVVDPDGPKAARRRRPAIMDQDRVKPFEDRLRRRGVAGPASDEVLRMMEEEEAAAQKPKAAGAKA